MFTIAEPLVEPFAFVQVMVKVVCAVIALLCLVPVVVANGGDMPGPVTVQPDVVFVELQVTAVVPPEVTRVGFVLIDTIGRIGAVTRTVAVAGAEVPPAPAQVT